MIDAVRYCARICAVFLQVVTDYGIELTRLLHIYLRFLLIQPCTSNVMSNVTKKLFFFFHRIFKRSNFNTELICSLTLKEYSQKKKKNNKQISNSAYVG